MLSNNISYSVVIRTLGNTGEKYRSLLSSIQNQTIKPEEIIVVLPHGYKLEDQRGSERIVYSPKGMVSQRASGIKEAKSEYILVVDDDVEFDNDFVENLHFYLLTNKLDCVLPMEGAAIPNTSELFLNLPLFAKIRGFITGQVFVSKKKSIFLDTITITAGHKIWLNSNKLDECYYCQCGSFQCFYLNTKVAQAARFDEEMWLQEGTITQYASYDDPTFFYKLYLNGYKIAYNLRARYTHLDAAAGRKTKTKLQEKIIRYYSVARNRTIFWYRLIYKPQTIFCGKIKALFGGLYGTINYAIYNIIINIHPRYWPAIKAMFVGYKDAIKFILSKK